MSIYFQYPTIEDYPNLCFPAKLDLQIKEISKDEDSINQDYHPDLKDFLTLKPV